MGKEQQKIQLKRLRKLKPLGNQAQRDFKYPLYQMSNKDIKEVRELLYEEQKGICPICEYKIDKSIAVLDHLHKEKGQVNGEDGAGAIRQMLCFQCNSLDGKLLKQFQRSGLKKYIKFDHWVENYLRYIRKKPKLIKGKLYIHPTEKEDDLYMGKQLFNKLNKLYKEKYPNRKPLEVPKSIKTRGKFRGKWKITKKWEDLLKEFNLE